MDVLFCFFHIENNLERLKNQDGEMKRKNQNGERGAKGKEKEMGEE